MSEKKSWPFLLIAGLLIAASTTASFISSRKKVVESCRDVRIAMDGSYSAVIETGGLNVSPQLTIYQEHNRKQIKVDRRPVSYTPSRDGRGTYVGEGLRLEVSRNVQKATGRNIASLEGAIRGERVRATLSCSH